jgi:CheY-like chemotaxis protein
MIEDQEPRILCVDDEPNVLAGLERVLGFDFDVYTATSGARALATIEEEDEPFAVVMSDMRMPEMNGAELLATVRETSPDSVRILLTGHADMSAAIAAVNEGGIFRFLTKPCPGPQLIQTLEEACEQYRLLRAEQTLLDQTLRGAVRVMTELLSLVNPGAFSRAERVGAMMRKLAEETGAENPWELELAGLLSQTGCVAVPQQILARKEAGESLTEEEEKLYLEHPRLAYDLLRRIPRLERVAAMVLGQSPGALEGLEELNEGDGEVVEAGAQLLGLALELDGAIRDGATLADAVGQLSPERYGARTLATVSRIADARLAAREAQVMVDELSTDMVLAQDVRMKTGVMLVAEGQRVTQAVLSRLTLIAARQGIDEPISVSIQPE